MRHAKVEAERRRGSPHVENRRRCKEFGKRQEMATEIEVARTRHNELDFIPLNESRKPEERADCGRQCERHGPPVRLRPTGAEGHLPSPVGQEQSRRNHPH